MSLANGQVISSYKILAPLGAGAMGEVYRARDTRLDRDVAIKVLPDSWASDQDRVLRFEREARTLATLNHPSVAQIYGVDELDGVNFIVMELVDGEELATRIERGPIAVDETLRICWQIAEGLEAAHEVGVVHRDLKPANVRMTPHGDAKILDFGLAKPMPRAGAGSMTMAAPGRAVQTEEGLLLGTPTYMSPEQARGHPVDRRTDIWSFGCVLYECLTGAPPFGGNSLADIFAAVVEKAPDLSRLPAAVPGRIRQLIARCLDKNRRTRLQDIGEARIALDPARAAADPEPAVARRGIPLVAMLVTIILVAVATAWVTHRVTPTVTPASPLATARFTTIAGLPGTEFDATLSRDGKWVAFVSDRDGPFDLLAGPVGAGQYSNRTEGRMPVWSLKVRDIGFTLDGNEIWLRGGDPPYKMKWIQTTGDSVVRNMFEPEVVNVDWSPDGTQIVYHRPEDGDALFVAEADMSHPGKKILEGDSGVHQHYPIWSFDGHWIFVVRGRPATGDMDLWRVRADGQGRPEQLTDDKKHVAYPTPIDARTVLYVARELDGSGPWLWALDLETRKSRRASIGVEQYRSIAASKDGRRLVATVANPSAHLWEVPILPGDGVAKESDARPLEELRANRALAPRFASGEPETVFYLSSRGGADGLWRHRAGKTDEILRGSEYALQEPPAASPDGQWLAVVVRREGEQRVHLVSADGAHASRHFEAAGVDVRGAACFSPDGDWIAVGGSDADGKGLFKLPVRGGDPVRIVTGEALNPVWSPRGDSIVYMGLQIGPQHRVLAVHPDKGEPPVEILTVGVTRAGERMRFLPDGSGLVYMQGARPSQDFHLLDLDTRKTRRLTQLDDAATMRTFDISPDGKRIVFDRIRSNSDVVLIELEAPAE